MTMQNNYDRIAPIYDALSRMVYGNSIRAIQIDLLSYIPARARILVVGGGTGWILEEISKIHPSGLKITYVEISKNMIQLAQKRDKGSNIVDFVNLPIEDFHPDFKFDFIFTAFLFDNFAPKKIQEVFSQLDILLKPEGIWLFADFNIGKRPSDFWQKFLLKMMLLFFRVLSQIEARYLEQTAPLFVSSGYTELRTFHRYGRFIQSIVYQKK